MTSPSVENHSFWVTPRSSAANLYCLLIDNEKKREHREEDEEDWRLPCLVKSQTNCHRGHAENLRLFMLPVQLSRSALRMKNYWGTEINNEEWDETRQTTSRSSRKRFTFRDYIFYTSSSATNKTHTGERRRKTSRRNGLEERRKKFLENNKKTIFSLAKRTKTAMPVSFTWCIPLTTSREGRRKRFFSTVVVFIVAR